jgi:hypothetical protein
MNQAEEKKEKILRPRFVRNNQEYWFSGSVPLSIIACSRYLIIRKKTWEGVSFSRFFS